MGDIKKKQNELESDKEQIIEKAEKVEKDVDKEEIVDKLVDIKKKQQELDEAKKDFFSVRDDSEQSERQNKVNTDKSENAISEQDNVVKNDLAGLDSKPGIPKESPTLNVDQDDIQSLIKLPEEASNQTVQQPVFPTSPIPVIGSLAPSSLPIVASTNTHIISMKLGDPSSNGSTIVANMSNGSNTTLDNGTEQDKKIHIILDVNKKDDVLNKQ